MNIDDILTAIEDWPFGMAVNESAFWFPFVESVHVLSFAFMVGSIFFVDLRLLGFLGKGNPVRQASRILPFTWIAFVVATITGTLINLYDDAGVQVDTESWPVDAEWGPDGALCVNHVRGGSLPSCFSEKQSASCGSFENGALLIDEYNGQ